MAKARIKITVSLLNCSSQIILFEMRAHVRSLPLSSLKCDINCRKHRDRSFFFWKIVTKAHVWKILVSQSESVGDTM